MREIRVASRSSLAAMAVSAANCSGRHVVLREFFGKNGIGDLVATANLVAGRFIELGTYDQPPIAFGRLRALVHGVMFSLI